MIKVKVLANVVVLILFAGFIANTIRGEGDEPQAKTASYVGDGMCTGCHGDVSDAFSKTAHGQLADFQVKDFRKGCESCHGPGSIHAESSNPEDITVFKDLSPSKASEVCLRCHTNGSFMTFSVSEHNINDVSCISCHRVHQTRDNHNLVLAEDKLCLGCHKDIASKLNYPSHHPLREGKMTCLDCHDPHSGEKNLKTVQTPNDLCFECHTDKQGPFTFEHEPVVEDCGLCHEPHGTLVNNLLKKTEPYLCLQCHQFHFQIAEHSDVRGLASSACTHCHTAIHGSDLPSALKTNAGKSLTR
jgi:DmsE family decaheme c-type cytochrome